MRESRTHDLGLEVDVRAFGAADVVVGLLLCELEPASEHSTFDQRLPQRAAQRREEEGSDARLERVPVRLERLVREARADLADHLVRAAVGVVAREVERAVHVGALALAVVAADDDEVERVADALQVVLLELRTFEPINYESVSTALTRRAGTQRRSDDDAP